MGYAVHYRDAAGSVGLDEVETLEAALERVERLRNEESASDVRVFREVPIEVRTYYKVVAVEDGAAGRSEPPPGAMPLSPPPPPARPKGEVAGSDGAEADAAEAGEGSRRASLFGRT